MVDVFILSLLVGANIILTLVFRLWDGNKPTPLSSVEWHMFKLDEPELKRLFEKILTEYDRERITQLINDLENRKGKYGEKNGRV